jgi:peptidoglycan/LPS O-acetylase OafA/YrhL
MTSFGLIPFLFRESKSWLVDRHLGELSYPIYISHFLVIWLIDAAVVFGAGVARGIAILAGTVLVSCMLYWWVDRPVDQWRQRRFAVARRRGPSLIQQPGFAAVSKPAD